MAHSTSALSILLLIAFLSFVKIEARESKFFTKAIVIHENTTTKNVTHHVEPPSPAPSPAESMENGGGYGLYGHSSRDEIPKFKTTSDAKLFENKVSNNENFGEKMVNDEFVNKGLPSNYNKHSYVTVPEGDNVYDTEFNPTATKFEGEFTNKKENFVPQGDNVYDTRAANNYESEFVTTPQGTNIHDTRFNRAANNHESEFVTTPQGANIHDTRFNRAANNHESEFVTTPQGANIHDTRFNRASANFENEIANNEEKFTPEEEKLLNRNNLQNENSYVNFNEPEKLSETPRGNYVNYNNQNSYNRDNYNVKEAQGLSDTRTLENGKYYHPLDGEGRQGGYVKSGPQSEGYYGNNEKKSKYEFDTMEEYEKQEGYTQIPVEYIP